VACFGVEFLGNNSASEICNPAEVPRMITSGTLLNLDLFRKIGPFNEDLFIDQVDFEYCYRAILKGYTNVQFKNIFLNHALGATSFHRSLRSFSETKRSLHSPLRLYYMTRNYLYVKSKYKNDFPAEVNHSRKDLLNRIKNNLLYGTKRMVVIRNVFSGYIDFYRGKMGKK
jgi:rhamnosyltransferase